MIDLEIEKYYKLRSIQDDQPVFAVAYALLQVAKSQESIATQLKYLGVGDAATTVAMAITDALNNIATAIESKQNE